ncbi:hypothetical protein EYZ11_004447 [Aspergillus tanneri]|uniref:Uncharacterized protein n=1 Tax=Aspergillus tanneri TaxID=1220188 RepID=A0A4V3UPR2_9EURO|nr:hypothetical protein EYZ11_004447 [Aspergillus tanneri]
MSSSKAFSYYCGYTPFAHGFTFKSAVINGTATLLPYDGTSHCKEEVTEEDIKKNEKVYALYNIVEGMLPGEWENTRHPFKNEEVARVYVVRVDIDTKESHTHKRQDVFGYEADWETGTGKEYWEGAIPMWETYGSMIPGKTDKNLPCHLLRLFEQRNKDNKAEAEVEAKRPFVSSKTKV